MLILSSHDPSTLLEQLLVVPVRIDALELADDPIVLPQEDRVESGECWLFTCAHISSFKAFSRFSLCKKKVMENKRILKNDLFCSPCILHDRWLSASTPYPFKIIENNKTDKISLTSNKGILATNFWFLNPFIFTRWEGKFFILFIFWLFDLRNWDIATNSNFLISISWQPGDIFL